jgi:DNA-binding IclR family transcriptional regulator
MILDFIITAARSSPAVSATGGWVTTPYIADKLGLSESTVRSYLLDLETAGVIERKPNLFRGLWRPL